MADETFITNVRQRPAEVRRAYAFAFAAATMVIVLLIWFLGVNESFRKVSTDAPDLGNDIKAKVGPGMTPPPSIGELINEGKKLTVPQEGEKAEPDPGERLFQEQLEERGGAGEEGVTAEILPTR